MGRANVVRSQHAPLRIVPERGQVSEYVTERPLNKSRCGVVHSRREDSGDVLKEHKGRPRLADNAGDVAPEPARAVLRGSLPCGADFLTGEPSSDEIHRATPRSAIEGRDIVPNRGAVQGRVFHPRHEEGRAVAFPLNVANSAGSVDCEADSEIESAVSAAQADGS